MTTFSFRKTAHRCILCVTQSNWVKMWFSRFPDLPGSAEAQVTWGGIVKCLLIAYFIGNISAKKYQNPFMCVKVIASQRWDVFSRHGVYIVESKLIESNNRFRCANPVKSNRNHLSVSYSTTWLSMALKSHRRKRAGCRLLDDLVTKFIKQHQRNHQSTFTPFRSSRQSQNANKIASVSQSESPSEWT